MARKEKKLDVEVVINLNSTQDLVSFVDKVFEIEKKYEKVPGTEFKKFVGGEIVENEK